MFYQICRLRDGELRETSAAWNSEAIPRSFSEANHWWAAQRFECGPSEHYETSRTCSSQFIGWLCSCMINSYWFIYRLTIIHKIEYEYFIVL